jgi:hypothetical protein
MLLWIHIPLMGMMALSEKMVRDAFDISTVAVIYSEENCNY